MFSPRSFRLCRRLALCLALATFLATLAPPLHASPLDRAGARGPVLGLFDWVQGLLSSLGVGDEAEGEQGLEAAFAPEGSCMDPIGNTVPCSKPTTPRIPTEFSSPISKPEGKGRVR